MRDIKYRWVYDYAELGSSRVPKVLRDVGLLADGTLHNPNGYPEEAVRLAVLAAIEDGKKRRSKAAKKAALTRSVRTKRRVYEAVQKLLLGHRYGPRTSCHICGKGLGDRQSIERGIGSDCWQEVMKVMTQQREEEDSTGVESVL